MMRPGDRVIATAFGNKKIERVFVQRIDTTVVICTQEEWNLALLEKRSPKGVGFPFYAVRPLLVMKSRKGIKAS
jgi:hypothetical protein